MTITDTAAAGPTRVVPDEKVDLRTLRPRDEKGRLLPKSAESAAQDPSEEPMPAPVAGETSADEWFAPGFTRKPFGDSEYRLAAPKRKGFHRHWFNDSPGRIARAREAGYKHVKDQDGTPMTRTVGTMANGGGLGAFYMEIPREFFLADQKAAQVSADRIDQAIRGGKIGPEGGPEAGDGRYIPKGGISIKERDEIARPGDEED